MFTVCYDRGSWAGESFGIGGYFPGFLEPRRTA